MTTAHTNNHTEIIKSMYSVYDSSKWDELYNIFHKNIVYARPGSQLLSGIEPVIDFFKYQRNIKSGTHIIHKIRKITTQSYLCLGWYQGVLQNQNLWEEGFADILAFAEGKIILRKTYLDNQQEDQLNQSILKLPE